MVKKAENSASCRVFPAATAAHVEPKHKSIAVQSAPCEEDCSPSHWEYYCGPLESCILRMYRSPLPHVAPSSNHRALMLVRAFMLRSWNMPRGRVDVISVRQVENPLLYRRYIARRREIALATQGKKQPLLELAQFPNEKDVDTNVHGKCWSVGCVDACCCFFVHSVLNYLRCYCQCFFND